MQLWRNYLNKSPPMPRAINLKERLGPLIARSPRVARSSLDADLLVHRWSRTPTPVGGDYRLRLTGTFVDGDWQA
jgi:hypothetical protein